MTDDLHDEELRRLFREARDLRSARTPSFERVMTRRPAAGRRSWAGWLVVGAAAAAVVATVIVARGRTHRVREPLFTFAVGDLRMPTDFLLDIAGAETLRTVPPIGRTDDWFPIDSGSKGNPL